MGSKGCIVSLLLAFCLLQNFAYAQNISNEGTEFWAVFPSHDPSQQSLANITVYITSKSTSEVTVTCGTYSETQAIPANTPVPFTVDRNASYISHNESNQILSGRGIHIQVTPGFPKVVAYAHIFAGFRSAASLILPVESLGQKYYSMNFTQDNGGKNHLTLVATEPDTKLLLHELDGNILTIDFTQAGQVYEYMLNSTEDLTGVFVEVDPTSTDACSKRFAAFSGSTSVYIGCTRGRDPLYQQLYPTNSWGKTYAAVPFANRRYIMRVLAQEDNTSINFNGTTIIRNKGEYYEWPDLTDPAYISADKLISVAQYAYSQECSGQNGGFEVGDPDMILLNPIEFNIKNITMFSSDAQNIQMKFINIVMKTSATNSFRINGSVPPGSWNTISANPIYSYLQVQINDLSSNLLASDGFNAIAYGFGATESYAYSAGTNLASNNYLLVSNKITHQDAPAACLGQPSDFKLVLPAPATSIKWQLDGGQINTPPLVERMINSPTGTPLYEYTYAANLIFNTVSSHTMTVLVNLQTVSTCLGNNDTYTYSFDVDPVPISDFSINATNFCDIADVVFTDASNSQLTNKLINKWRWDFGDGSPIETVQNPIHRYASSGTYTVKLSAGIDDGCMSDVFEKKVSIVINPAPVVVFNAVPAVCISDAALQLNQATQTIAAVNGTGVYAGPGISTSGLFDPATAGPGVHQITYTFTGAGGCMDTKTQSVIVTPEPNLKIPTEINILEGGEFRMRVADASVDSRYEWTVPDSFLSNSNILNPIIQAGDKDRQYKLTVTTAGGCTAEYLVNVVIQNNLKPANTFSPNDDGVNDYWVIKYIETYPNTTVQIFNRLGEKVFFSNNYAQPFDGRYNGKALPVGTYYYIIDPKNGRPRLTGSLTIIR